MSGPTFFFFLKKIGAEQGAKDPTSAQHYGRPGMDSVEETFQREAEAGGLVAMAYAYACRRSTDPSTDRPTDQPTNRPANQPTSQPTTDRPIDLVAIPIAGAPAIPQHI
jgi:hypothetical protein